MNKNTGEKEKMIGSLFQEQQDFVFENKRY